MFRFVKVTNAIELLIYIEKSEAIIAHVYMRLKANVFKKEFSLLYGDYSSNSNASELIENGPLN